MHQELKSDRFLVTYSGTALSRNVPTRCLHETQAEPRSTLGGSLTSLRRDVGDRHGVLGQVI